MASKLSPLKTFSHVSVLAFVLPFLLMAAGSRSSELFYNKTGDSEKFKVFFDLAKSPAVSKHFDSIIYYASKAVEYAPDILSELKAENLIAKSFFYKGDYDSAKVYWLQNLRLADEMKDSVWLGKTINNIGLLSIYEAEYDSAIYYLKKAQAMKERHDKAKLGSTLNNIGLAYMKMEKYSKALPYFKKAAVVKSNNNRRLSLANTYNNIGIIYKNTAEHDSAIKYYRASLNIAIEFDDFQKQAFIYNNLATLYRGKQLYNKAIDNAKRSYDLKIIIGDKVGAFNTLNNLANIYIDIDNTTQALKALREAEAIEQNIEKNLFSFFHLKVWSRYYESTGQYQQSLEFLKKAMEQRVMEMDQDKNDKIAKWEIKYETQAKENEIQHMKLKQELIQARIDQKHSQFVFLILFFVSLFVALVLYLRIYKRKKKMELDLHQNRIEGLKNRIKELHTGMTVSLLPSCKDINQKIHTPLSEREYEVLKESLGGLKNAEIAEKLHISINTVKYHLRNVYQKLGVENRKGAFHMLIPDAV